MPRLRLIASAVGLLVSLSACSQLPKQVERVVSVAHPTPEQTPLGQLVAERRRVELGHAHNGFALLSTVEMAYAARLALIESARHTLDLQYYAAHADGSTEVLLQRLRDAAARGVRVRILLDDVNTSGKNAQVLRLGFMPNVEMRVFNPLPMSGWPLIARFALVLHDAKNMQQRMHNKQFIADNAMGITGGRNLGNVYFGQGADEANFVDLDVLAAGPVVKAMSASFDRYWNNPRSVPVQAVISLKALDRQREQVGEPLQTGEAGSSGEAAKLPVAKAGQAPVARAAVIAVAPASDKDRATGVAASTKGLDVHTAAMVSENRADAAELAERAAADGQETVQVSSNTPVADAKMPTRSQVAPTSDKVLTDAVMVAPTLSVLDLGRVAFHWAPAVLVADKPEKIGENLPEDGASGVDASAGGSSGARLATNRSGAVPPVTQQQSALTARVAGEDSVVDGLLSLMNAAQRDVLIISPYFVPGSEMMKVFEAVRARGVRVRVLTNSLASNDAVAAHAGYARYREPLLKLGVELYELRADNVVKATPSAERSALKKATSPRFGNPVAATVPEESARGAEPGTRSKQALSVGSRSSLHTKAAFFDGQTAVIGSMNLDMRSQVQNTEIALVLRSAAICEQAEEMVNATLARAAYQVVLDRSRLRWLAPKGAYFADETVEPGASWKQKALNLVIGPLAPDALL